jgi:hypothetical protein
METADLGKSSKKQRKSIDSTPDQTERLKAEIAEPKV